MPIAGIEDKATANHVNDSLSIYTMVLNRLPILNNDDVNKLLVTQFTTEVMHELNLCIQKEDTEIGIEANYSVIQQSIIADIVCCYLLISTFVQNANGGVEAPDGTTVGGNSFLKKAKAGSVEVEFDQISVKDSAALVNSGPALLESFKRSAIKKAATIGCIIDICDDCSVTIMNNSTPDTPFIVVNSSNCGCS